MSLNTTKNRKVGAVMEKMTSLRELQKLNIEFMEFRMKFIKNKIIGLKQEEKTNINNKDIIKLEKEYKDIKVRYNKALEEFFYM